MIFARLKLCLAGLAVASPLAAGEMPPAGAMVCAGCHPLSKAVETPVPLLLGRSEERIVAMLQAYRSGQEPATVMDRIAKGVTDDQALAIARWYARQSPP
jgi:sulfide dehydrogenase cytochrome subunit